MLGIVKSTLLGSPSGNLIWRVPGSSDVFYSLHAFPAVFTQFPTPDTQEPLRGNTQGIAWNNE